MSALDPDGPGDDVAGGRRSPPPLYQRRTSARPRLGTIPVADYVLRPNGRLLLPPKCMMRRVVHVITPGVVVFENIPIHKKTYQ